MATPRVQLKRIVRIINGGTPTPAEENWNGEIPWATPVDLNNVDGGFIGTTLRNLSEVGVRTGSVLVPEGSVILSTRAPIGYTAVATNQISFNQGCKALVPLHPAETDSRFLRYAIQASVEHLKVLGKGSTFLELSTQDLASFRILWPTLQEQKQIADELDRKLAEIDELIDNFESFHKVFRERYESELEELLNIELSNIPHQKLSWHVEFMNGDRGVSYPSRDEFVQSGVPFVNAGHLREGTVDFSEMNYISEAKYKTMGGAKLHTGDVLYCLRGSVGKYGIYSKNHGALASSLVALRAKNKLLPKFILILLSSHNVQLHINTLLTGSAQPNLSVEQLSSIRVPIPSIPQQYSIIKKYEEKKFTLEALNNILTAAHLLLSERKVALLKSFILR